MKQLIKYRFLTITNKLHGEVRLSLDSERSNQYNTSFDGGRGTNLTIYPIISISIVRPPEIDANGQRVRAPWNQNDSIGMTKYNLPVFINELKEINNDLKKPDMYTYHGKRLEINHSLEEKARRVFMINTTTIELTPVVIAQLDDTRVEGIKMKFNNEQSTVLLTLNDITSLIYNLENLDVDNIAMTMFLNFVNRAEVTFKPAQQKSVIDIAPKEFVE